jgi:hypothetical protein
MKRPRAINRKYWSVSAGRAFEYEGEKFPASISLHAGAELSAKDARKLAAWLFKAAIWLDKEMSVVRAGRVKR